jgi:hypothetical protein
MLGGAQAACIGDAKRWQWRQLQARTGREAEEGGEQAREGERRRRQGPSYPLAQSIGGGEDLLGESTMAGAPQCCFTVLRKTKEILQKCPLVFGIFWKFLKTAHKWQYLLI